MFPIADDIPRRHEPVVSISLILITIGIFLLSTMLDPDMAQRLFHLFGVIPARYTHPDWASATGMPTGDYWPFLTTLFLHGSFAHIFFNMWFLWLFGRAVEDQLGPVRFAIFYLLAGILAGIIHVLVNPDSTIPAIGASGAISGVMAAYLLLHPRANMIVMIPIFFFPFFFTVPSVIFIGIWFVIEFFSGTASLFSPPQVAGIAFWAHIGGFVAGLILTPLAVASLTNRTQAWNDIGLTNSIWSSKRNWRN